MAKKRSSGRRTPQEGVREKASGAANSPGTPSGPRADPTSGSKRESTTNVFASGLVDGGDGDHGDSPGNPLVLLADRVWRSRWLAPALLGFVALVWFGPTLVTNSRLAFRDVSHFYTPLYEYISTRLAQRELPLWNPLIVTGTPIVGDNTSAVFYPPRLVFALGMSTETAMTWYCAMHMILAGCGAAYAARRHGCQGTLAWLAGIAYACSAPVIEQYSNPPFLVGAAWLPWGVSGMFQTISGGSRRAIALTALALAMPVLAGDPQTTMHTLLIGGTYWTVLQIKRRWLKRSASTAPNLSQVRGVAPEFVRRSASGRDSAVHVYTLPLVLACGISLMAAFIQVWPTLQWSTHSGRNIEAPAGIARVLAGPVASSTDRRWYQEPEPNTHADLIYNFSIGPWMAVDVFAPNILGQLKPISGRMSRLWATSEVFWNSSLYCGGFIAIAALCAFTRLRLGRWHVMALLAFLLSLGRFGFVPLIQLIGRWRNEEWLQGYDPALFTPYWWLVTCVPAYASFRYPAKWMPVFALGMAVGAVAWLREATQQDLRRFRYCALGIAILFATVALMSYSSLVLQYANKAKNVGATIDQFYGPMQMSVAFNWLRWACLHAFLLSMFLWWRFARTERVGVAEDSGLPGQLALLLACEMAIAGTAWVDRLPRYREPLIGISEEDVTKLKREGIVDSPAILRVLDDKRQFGPWLSTWSPNRFIEVERNEQRTLVALWNLTHDLVNINAVSTIAPRIQTTLWSVAAKEVANQTKSLGSDEGKAKLNGDLYNNLLRWMSVDRTLSMGRPTLVEYQKSRLSNEPLTIEGKVPGMKLGFNYRPPAPETLQLTDPLWTTVPDPLPVVRWYPRVEPIPQVPANDPAKIWPEILPTILADPAKAPAWASLTAEELAQVPAPESDAVPQIKIISSRSESAEIEVENSASGWLYLHVFQDGYWRAEIESSVDTGGDASLAQATRQSITPVTINLMGQGIWLPKGKHRIRVAYEATWVLPTMIVSVIGWCSIGFLAMQARRAAASHAGENAGRSESANPEVPHPSGG